MLNLNNFKITKNIQFPERIYKYDYSMGQINYSLFTRDSGKTFYCAIDIGKGKDAVNIYNNESESIQKGIDGINFFCNSIEGEKKFNEYGYYISRLH